jgi:hypothetical protein
MTERTENAMELEKVELEKIAERILGKKCILEEMICNEPCFSTFTNLRIFCEGMHIAGYAVVENPEFCAWHGGDRVRYEGRFVIFRINYAGAAWVYALLRIL